jgi:hypothetical protein
MKVLFYSQHCEHSKNIIIMIQKSQLQDEIKMFCIDGFQPLPKFLTHVPTLKIYSPQEQILIGPQILTYLNQHKEEDSIQDQTARSSGSYTMLDGDDPVENEIDAVYNTHISTPQGQMPIKEEKSQFPKNEKLQSSGGLDMAFETLVAERNYGNSVNGVAKI